jgi:hypothetical protein
LKETHGQPDHLFLSATNCSHTRTTTATPSFTLSGLIAARDPSLALTTLLCTFTRISSIAKKIFFGWLNESFNGMQDSTSNAPALKKEKIRVLGRVV